MSIKVFAASMLAGLGVFFLAIVQPWKRAGDKLRNRQGVGPAHLTGVSRGEEQVHKKQSHEPTTVAGRIRGSIAAG